MRNCWVQKISLFSLVCGMLFIGVMGFCYPFQGDDFTFIVAARDTGIGNYAANAYMNWTLRIGELFVMLVFTCGKTLFNLLNPIFQLWLALVLFRFGFQRFPKWNDAGEISTLALLFAMSAFLAARPRDTVFWATGACVYAWGLSLWFLFWSLMRDEKQAGTWYAAGMFILGTFAATVLENVMAVGVLMGALMAVQAFRRKRSLHGWQKSGLTGYAVGTLLVLCAPGRWVRMAEVTGSMSFMERLHSIAEVGVFWIGSAWTAFLLGGMAFLLLFLRDKKRWKAELGHTAILLGLSALSVSVFALSGVTPAVRAYLFSSLFIALAAVRLLALLRSSGGNAHNAATLLTLLSFLFAAVLLITSIPDFQRIRREQAARDSLIEQQKNDNPVIVPEHSSIRKHFLQYIWIEDITEDENAVPNRFAAQYYRVSALRIARKEPVQLYWNRKGVK